MYNDNNAPIFDTVDPAPRTSSGDKPLSKYEAMRAAAATNLLQTDIDALDDIRAKALFRASTKGLFCGVEDVDGRLCFGTRASTDPRQNLKMLVDCINGGFESLKDPKLEAFDKMSREEQLKTASEDETFWQELGSTLREERGPGLAATLGAGVDLLGAAIANL